MSDSDDLLGKADAFLKRYHPSAAPASDDIPVLTEVVPAPAERPNREPSADKSQDSVPKDPDSREIEQRLRQRVIEAIQPYIANFLDESLRARLEDHLRRSLAALTDQVRADIETLMRDAVAKVVEGAVAEIRKSSRGDRT
jgi:hypothetical protein